MFPEPHRARLWLKAAEGAQDKAGSELLMMAETVLGRDPTARTVACRWLPAAMAGTRPGWLWI